MAFRELKTGGKKLKTRSRSEIKSRPTKTQASSTESGSQARPDETPFVHGDEIPIPEAIESDGESIWEVWQQAVTDVTRPFADTMPMRGIDDSGE